MRYKYLLICLGFLLFAACKDMTKFALDGHVTNFNSGQKVYLYVMKKDKMDILDSTLLSDKGDFKFEQAAPDAQFYRISIGDNEYLFIAKNGDKISFNADLKQEIPSYTLNGSEDADKMVEFNTLRDKNLAAITKLRSTFDTEVAAHPEKRDQLVREISPAYTKVLEDMNADIVRFALANPHTLVSFYAISMANPEGNEENYIKYVANIDPSLKKNEAVSAFIEQVAKLKTLVIGAQAPDFSIPGIDGKTISLKDFRGKYVMLDFWASWCAPCRAENPNVVKAYQKYNKRNFTILGISLDKDKAAWEQAIKQDGLTWTHAGELADFEGETVRLYQVEAIPASFIVDPAGKIIARNLRGDALEAFLNKTLP